MSVRITSPSASIVLLLGCLASLVPVAHALINCNKTTPSQTLLYGEHLVITASPTPHFFIVDKSASGVSRYSGIDIEILEALARLLKFSYTIRVGDRPAGNETWTDVLFRSASTGDVVMGYWEKMLERRNNPMIEWLEPHVDLSYTLVTTPATTELKDTLPQFLDPFEYSLWGMVVALLVVTGLGLYAIEFSSRRSKDYKDTELPWLQSVYLMFSLFTATGGPKPVTVGGKILLTTVGFSLVIIVAAYTANLATVLIGQAQGSVSSISNLMAKHSALCVGKSFLPYFKASYPGLKLYSDPKWTSNYRAIEGLRAGHCAAAMATVLDWRTHLNQGDSCDLINVATLASRSTGWVARADTCLISAFNWAVQELLDTGKIHAIIAKNLPERTCDPSRKPGEKLSISDFNGIFLLNGAALVVALVSRLPRAFSKQLPNRMREVLGLSTTTHEPSTDVPLPSMPSHSVGLSSAVTATGPHNMDELRSHLNSVAAELSTIAARLDSNQGSRDETGTKAAEPRDKPQAMGRVCKGGAPGTRWPWC